MRFVFILLFSFIGFAQDKPVIYVDDNFQKIPQNIYKQQQATENFLEAEITTDSVTYKKLYYKNYFGSVSKEKKSQLNKLLFQRYGLDTTKVWVIHYKDSLPDASTLPPKNKMIYFPIDSSQESIDAAKYLNNKRKVFNSNYFSSIEYSNAMELTTHKHNFSYKSWYKVNRKEYKKYRKVPDALLLHFYEHNAGFPTVDREVVWYEDPYKIIKSLFSDGVKHYSTIILHPDGDFYVSYYSIGFDMEKEMIDKSQFNKNRKEHHLKF